MMKKNHAKMLLMAAAGVIVACTAYALGRVLCDDYDDFDEDFDDFGGDFADESQPSGAPEPGERNYVDLDLGKGSGAGADETDTGTGSGSSSEQFGNGSGESAPDNLGRVPEE